jgi:protoheme IX farnesyltransferase
MTHSKVSLLAAALVPWMQLIKMPLCLSVAGSTGFGYILHTPTLSLSLAATTCGVLFLACGAAGGNSLQEVAIDGLLPRTCKRPLVTGRLSARQAAWFSTLLVILGLVFLWLGTEKRLPLALGIAAIILYNGVYTPFKNVSIITLFPGGLAGSLPPLIGWTAAGGLLSDYRAWLLFALFFLWQIPHFCLILLSYHEDYQTLEEPTLVSFFSNQSLTRITLVWILAFIVVALSFTLDANQLVIGSRLAIAIMAVILIFPCGYLFFKKESQDFRFLFLVLNGSFFATLLIVAIFQLFASR